MKFKLQRCQLVTKERILIGVIYLGTVSYLIPTFIMRYVILLVLFGTSLFTLCEALECFICDKQEDNLHKCVKTMATCEQGEDMCLTEVKWGSMPYWQQGADKQYYISKRCATKTICERARNRAMPYCTHIWYEDWKCVDCCHGDRCNYYVILAGSTARSSYIILGLSMFALFGAYQVLRL